MRAAMFALLLVGCATTDVQHEVYVEQIAVTNPEAVCAGADRCALTQPYRGLSLCQLVSLPTLGHGELGALLRGCFK